VLEADLEASNCLKDMPTTGGKDAEHVRSIQQAIQTITMVDMCKIAARNFWIAVVAAIAAAWVAICK